MTMHHKFQTEFPITPLDPLYQIVSSRAKQSFQTSPRCHKSILNSSKQANQIFNLFFPYSWSSMAASIRVTLPSSTSIRSSTSSSSASCHPAASCSLPLNHGFSSRPNAGGRTLLPQDRRASFVVRSNMETITEPAAGQVTEVNQDTFWPLVKAAGDKVVVLDMYTQWCGPCKIIAPKFQQLSEKYLDVVFMKLDCNQENKALAKELGIRVVPTFKILKESKIVKEVTGAKFDDLVFAIDTVKST